MGGRERFSVSSTSTTHDASASQWTERESELLAVTLRLLQQHGYDRLTVEAVATEAKSSKATIYRRWPSKTELVLAAFIEGTRVQLVPPRTGSLRTDLLTIGTSVCTQAREHGSTMSAIMSEIAHSPELSAALQSQFVLQRKKLMRDVLTEAVERGEIKAQAIHDELWDVMPGYLVFRSLIPGRPPTEATVRALVDDVLMPSLTRF
ncbi:TetR/AcrR family transcriptional regulator [Mycolicibacterium fortuitum]|jgi:AcrR family transcriptional regulator|uniref:TetR family transcriptional regulator n=1 Tax=Mycolicibacterium fortuitum subsp. fortuitum DSM 46621 = ATCC 6841 = JCM 6387 TaxID=1214102 RepID=K0UN03_MYCFO|nr:TetR/AcrR family transcriptional regulator [Mycolicibacterium fortuitum]AMD53656.1 TetR family transcriptional regulator [Mycolicibacterium fortuitum subsp. fortuitum DSM 46621 = ATCC 6841 = JCM 6387]EJZ08216.1 TetR family transcriptional regulator [Mycolicibacterium fortuitum subsp. fortuitum DSM 46621 = ATCC 6841 = JCM 6387]UBV21515.1 TetR/AcrR family transcriptional regulator [Mycolicibacterium fortuitum]